MWLTTSEMIAQISAGNGEVWVSDKGVEVEVCDGTLVYSKTGDIVSVVWAFIDSKWQCIA